MTDEVIRPILGKGVFIASTSYVGGDVELGDGCTIMHHVMIRGDVAPIRIGRRCNIQDGSIVHCKTGQPLEMEDEVSVGHRAVVHCTRVGGRSLIGTGAIVLDDTVIGRSCVIAAGTVVVPGTQVPDGKVVMGTPGRVVRDINDRDLAMIEHVVTAYQRLGREHASGRYPHAVNLAAD